MTDDTATCVSCKARILWRPTIAGNRMPIDPEPVGSGEGNVALREVAGVEYALVVGDGCGTHVSHFSTCPGADQHRRPRRPRQMATSSARPTAAQVDLTLPFGGDV